MPSPDFSSYVDLTLFDTDATAILNSIIEHARGLIPTWVPEAGNIEVALAEAFANETASLISYINRLPDATAEVLLQLFGVTKSDGTKAAGTVTVTMTDTLGHTVAAGTPMAYFSNAGTSLVYVTDIDMVVASGASSGTVAVSAQIVGTGHNAPSIGDAVQVLSNLSYVQAISFSVEPAGGTTAESDATYLDRGANLLASYSSALVTPSQIAAHVLSTYPVAYRCEVYDKRRFRDRDTKASGYSTHPGYVLIAVARQNADQSDTSDIAVSAANLAIIEAGIEGRTSAGLAVDIMSSELVQVDVTCAFVALSGFDSSAVETTVGTALDVYLDPNAWDWSKQVVRINELIALIDGVAGVDYITGITLNASKIIGPGGVDNFTDTSLLGIELHNLGTLVISGTHSITGTAAS
jgi:hypothetical protein